MGIRSTPLKARWETIRPKALLKSLREGDSPFGATENDLQDFRGLVLNEVLSGVKVECCDFSRMKFDGFGQFGDCEFRDCMVPNLGLMSEDVSSHAPSRRRI